MIKRFCAILAFLIITVVDIYAGGIPVVAYMGVPYNHSTEQYFKEFKNAGFDICVTNYPKISDAKKALTIADKVGVKIIARCVEADNNKLRMVRELMAYPALYGYLVYDEPDSGKLGEIRQTVKKIRQVDPKHFLYMNILPYYGKAILKHTKTKDYDSYVNLAIATGVKVLSFDHYPITTKGLRSEWYENLEIIRRESRRVNIPFWGFVLSTSHLSYPQPTIASLRLQVYSNLAYGAQGIQYYTYWTPKDHDNFNYRNGPVSYDGKKTKTYNIVKTMNTEIRTIGSLFHNADVVSVRHLLRLPKGTKQQDTTPLNIKKMMVIGKEGAIVSQFTKNGKQYLALVNKDYRSKMTVDIVWSNNIPVQITKQLKTMKTKKRYTVAAGDILVFRLS